MKKTTLIVMSLMALVLTASCGSDNASARVKTDNVKEAQKRDAEIMKGAAEASFDKSEYDFGQIIEGDVVETTFTITNTGKTDLVITNASTTCGCTVPQWPRDPIAPGASEEIKVKFNSRGKVGRQVKNITLVTNTKTGREVLKIKGQVERKSK